MRRTTLLLTLVSAFGLLQSCSGTDDAPAAGAESVAAASAGSTGTLPVTATFDAASSTFQDLEGRGLEIASFAGKKVFVNYWATWCAPCIREIPSIARAAAELADENYLFVLASDESPDAIRDFIADRGFDGHFIKLNGYFGAYGINAVPSSSLYDEQGQLLQSWAGAFEWDSPEMLEQLRNPQPATP
jgi:thiol-disulfide isomerase/thioredoxin